MCIDESRLQRKLTWMAQKPSVPIIWTSSTRSANRRRSFWSQRKSRRWKSENGSHKMRIRKKTDFEDLTEKFGCRRSTTTLNSGKLYDRHLKMSQNYSEKQNRCQPSVTEAFPTAASWMWNSLPLRITSAPSPPTFRTRGWSHFCSAAVSALICCSV